jgi:hypothetical protein
MMNKDTLIAIGAGSLSAVAALTFQQKAPGGLVFAYFAPLPLMLIGLSLGAVTGTISAIAGVITSALLGGLVASALFAVLHAFPAWIITRQSLLKQQTPNGQVQWYPIGNIISLLALMAAFMLTMVAIAEWQNLDTLRQNFSRQFDQTLAVWLPTLTDPQRAGLVTMFIMIFPALIATSWLFMTVINGIIAQSILVKMDKNLRPRPVYSALALPEWHSWAVVSAACLALLGSGNLEFMGRTLAIIFSVPFFFVGLAVVHRLERHLTFPGLLLAAVYISIFLSLWAALVVAIIGVIEQWFGLRHRLPAHRPNTGSNQEDE